MPTDAYYRERIAELEAALREIADNTPNGSHPLHAQLAPEMTRINHIAQAALGPLPAKTEGSSGA